MANEYNSKIVLANGEVLLDLTQDDVEPKYVQSGIYFHDKTGKRQPGTNTFTVDASGVTAVASEVLATRTFGKGSEVQTGTMPNNSGKDVIITSKDGTPIPIGYSDGSGVARLSDTDLAKLIGSNIKAGETILGVPGTYGADDMSSVSKEVAPTFEDQVFNPSDDGVTFYSSLTVKGIKVTRTDNEFGGVTVTIG